MQDTALAFGSNLVNRFMQFKGLQMQLEFQKRREERYERQLQAQVSHQTGMLKIRGEEVEARKAYYERYRPSTISIFSPSQVGTLGKTAETTLQDVEIAKTGGALWFGRTKSVRKSDLLAEYKSYQIGIGYQTLSLTEQQQADFAFDEKIKQLDVDETNWNPDTDYDIRSLRPYTRAGIFRAGGPLPGEPKPTAFKGETSSDTEPAFLQGTREAQPESPFAPSRKIGDIVVKGGKRYRIVGFDTDGEPLVEIVP